MHLEARISSMSLKKHTSHPTFQKGASGTFSEPWGGSSFPHCAPPTSKCRLALQHLPMLVLFLRRRVFCVPTPYTLINFHYGNLFRRRSVRCHQIQVPPEELRCFTSFFLGIVCKNRRQPLKGTMLKQISAICSQGFGNMFIFL